MTEHRRPDEDAPPPKSRVGDRSLAFAAAFALHAAILVPFLMRLETRQPAKPGASAVMVNIVRADSGQKETKAEPEKPDAKEPPQKPAEKPEPPRAGPAIVEAPKKAPASRERMPSEEKHSSAPAAFPAQPSSSASKGKPGGAAASGASEAGIGDATAKASYRDRLKSWLAAHKHYPDAARRQKIEGVAMLHFKVARDGRVLSHEIAQSSGSEILDREVERMLERAEPLPPFPPELNAASLDVSLPIGFHLTPSDF